MKNQWVVPRIRRFVEKPNSSSCNKEVPMRTPCNVEPEVFLFFFQNQRVFQRMKKLHEQSDNSTWSPQESKLNFSKV